MNNEQTLSLHVLQGLSAPQKALSSAWFYDDEGSRIFQRIMTLPEYYLTRVEHAVLRERADDLVQWIADDNRAVDLIELGSGDGEKTLTLCQSLHERGLDCTYRPMDVSAHALAELSQRFQRYLPRMALEPMLADYFEHWPSTSPQRRQVAMLLGSNLGNLTEGHAVALLQRVRARLRKNDVLLLGLDMVKDPHAIRAAYDDAQGVTAEFNMNLLRRLNRELGMNFDLNQFRHFANYCPLTGVARSFLVSVIDQVVSSRVLQCDFSFRAGETIFTEQSQKYTPESISHLARSSGFHCTSLITDPNHWYSLAVWHNAELNEHLNHNAFSPLSGERCVAEVEKAC